MSLQDTGCGCGHARASTQIKCWACLQSRALLFYLIGGICYIWESLLMSLKHVNTKCACRYEHAHNCKNVRHTQTHTGTQIYFTNLHKVAWHTEQMSGNSRFSHYIRWCLHHNPGSVLWKVFEDADLALLRMTKFTTCSNNKCASDLLNHHTTNVITSTLTDILWHIKRSPNLR